MIRRKQRRLGAAMVELAIILSILLLLCGGIIDFSRYAYYYIAVSNSAGAGARFATLHPYTPTTLATWNARTSQAVRDDLQGIIGYDASRVTVATPTVVTEATGLQLKKVRVQVSYAFQTIVAWPGIASSATITRAVEMRMLR